MQSAGHAYRLIGQQLKDEFGEILPMPELLMHAVNFLVSFVGISALFALIFKYVPEATIKERKR